MNKRKAQESASARGDGPPLKKAKVEAKTAVKPESKSVVSQPKQPKTEAKAASKPASSAAKPAKPAKEGKDNGDPTDVELRQRLRRAAWIFTENFIKTQPVLSPPDYSMSEIAKLCLGKLAACTALPDGLPAATGDVKQRIEALSFDQRWQAFCSALDMFNNFKDKREPWMTDEALASAKVLQEAISAKRRRKLKRKKTTKKHQHDKVQGGAGAGAAADGAAAGKPGKGGKPASAKGAGASQKGKSKAGAAQKSLKGKGGLGKKSKKGSETAPDDFSEKDLAALARDL